MYAALRPHVTAGVALVGACVIAVTPVSPVTQADIRVASPAVQLTAAPNPLEFYPQVAVNALSNAGTLAQQYLTVPPALVTALVTQPIPTLASALFVFTNPGPYLFTPASFISPVISGIGATIVAFADVVTALASGNLTNVFNAVVDIPARIADGVLNGGYPPPNILPISFGGILTPFIESGPDSIAFPGPIGLPILIATSILNGVPSSIRSAHLHEASTPEAALDSGSAPVDQGLLGSGSAVTTPTTDDLTTGADTTDAVVPATVDTESPEQIEPADAAVDLTGVDAETPVVGTEPVAAEGTPADVADVAVVRPGRVVRDPAGHRSGVLTRMREHIAEKRGRADDAPARDHDRFPRAAARSHSQAPSGNRLPG